MKILLSIKPEFAEKIFDGTKSFEFRKAIFKNQSVKTVVVYATRPVGKIVGEFDIDCIFEDSPNNLWIRTKNYAGITKDFFDSYFSGRNKGYAISIAETREYEDPIDPGKLIENFSPPQSYMYLDDDLQRLQEREQATFAF
ncbi:MAG TPA: hypothetical protein VGO06_16585 [Bosea sp. (in: a-proteobacteria)]|jgi:predicted transcriptional regulator|uniref:hypothetical protein n=1 Tax=Bosea sp. (in: a-proteobacteria) TaxID=1871050 RepID=UPI002E11505D|nr:hypothetical protein [Bosea sp. (in: a-proteobacteria)]